MTREELIEWVEGGGLGDEWTGFSAEVMADRLLEAFVLYPKEQ